MAIVDMNPWLGPPCFMYTNEKNGGKKKEEEKSLKRSCKEELRWCKFDTLDLPVRPSFHHPKAKTGAMSGNQRPIA